MRKIQVSAATEKDFNANPQATLKRLHAKYGTTTIAPTMAGADVVLEGGKRIIAILKK